MMKTPKEVFVHLLSKAWHGTDRTTQFYQELSQAVQNPEAKEALEARVFVLKGERAALDQCFKLIGEKPVAINERLHDLMAENFREELAEIQTPIGKLIYVLGAAQFVNQIRLAGYQVLIAAADKTGHYGVGVLLESVLADKIAFAERNRRFIRNIVETKVAEKMAA